MEYYCPSLGPSGLEKKMIGKVKEKSHMILLCSVSFAIMGTSAGGKGVTKVAISFNTRAAMAWAI